MSKYVARMVILFAFFAVCLLGQSRSQDVPQLPPLPVPMQPGAPVANAPGSPQDDQVPQGVEVLARGPVHEAFATPTSEPKPTAAVAKKPPAPLEEMAPEDKPEGDVSWISGYWGWDDDRQDFLWVSGCWRAKPEGKDWVPGYWREQGGQWQWVPGFWTSANLGAAAGAGRAQEVTYYPEPPAPPQLAPPGDPPGLDMIYAPGHYFWAGNHYVWRAGYWTRGRPGYVYVASHYRWTPFGHVFVAGYWDLAVSRRGVLYAPVYVDPVVVVGGRFAYTPYYAVSDAVVLDAMFIRPSHCHYYFGDYYGPRYRTLGFESVVVYGRRHYDPIVVYRRYEYRENPRWLDVQVNLVIARDSGRAPVPPRTLVQQRTVVNNVTNVTNVTNVNNVTINKNTTNNVANTSVSNTTVLAPAKNVLAAQGAKTVAVDPAARAQIKQSSQAVQQAALVQRQKTEIAAPGPASAKPRVASYNVPAATTAPPAGGLTRPNPGGPVNPLIGKSPAGPVGGPPGTGAPGVGNPPLGSTIKPPGTNPITGINPTPIGKGPVGPVGAPSATGAPGLGKPPLGNMPLGNTLKPPGTNPVTGVNPTTPTGTTPTGTTPTTKGPDTSKGPPMRPVTPPGADKKGPPPRPMDRKDDSKKKSSN